MFRDMSVWPEADVTLRERWLAGVPTAQIGRELGVSGDAVIGRAHRLNLPRHPLVAHCNLAPPKPRDQSHHAKRPHRRIRPLPTASGTTLPKLPSTPQPLAAQAPSSPGLPSGTCQFIAADVRSKGWTFCGEPSCAPGSPWCSFHKSVCYARRPTREGIES